MSITLTDKELDALLIVQYKSALELKFFSIYDQEKLIEPLVKEGFLISHIDRDGIKLSVSYEGRWKLSTTSGQAHDSAARLHKNIRTPEGQAWLRTLLLPQPTK